MPTSLGCETRSLKAPARKIGVEFYLYLAASFVVIRRLIDRAAHALPLAPGPPPAACANAGPRPTTRRLR